MAERPGLIYKILSVADWEAARRAGRFEGSADDRRDGFIHFSDGGQAVATARKYFAGQSDLMLLAVDPARLADLRWERSRDDALFPHLYGPLELDAVTKADRLPEDRTAADAVADLVARLTRFALLAVIRFSVPVVVALGATGPLDAALGAPRPQRVAANRRRPASQRRPVSLRRPA
jgi:uncharacterized protein (DUF952 family)